MTNSRGTGNNSYLRDLGTQYLQGSNLVSADRQKARYYFSKAGDYGAHELKAMDQFEINVKLADESPNAAYETGYAYFLGRGTQKRSAASPAIPAKGSRCRS
ncbi:hypothetical protein P4W15_20660 [Morganella morganii]|nr:hypothetical protein [Morganella morganii]